MRTDNSRISKLLKNSIIVAIGIAIGSAIGIFLSSLQLSADKIGAVDRTGTKGVVEMTQIIDGND